MSKRLTLPNTRRPLVFAPSYEIPMTDRNGRRLPLPEYDETLLNFDQGTRQPNKISDRGRYAEALFKVNEVVEVESEDYFLDK